AAGLKLVDRLVGVGSIAVSSTGVKNVGSPTLPRYTSGVGVLAYAEVDTAGTTTAVQLNLDTYTNEDGTTVRTGGTFTFNAATATRGSLQGPLPLAAGDRGVKSVETVNVTVAGAGSGVINIVLLRTLVYMPFGAFSGPG